MGNSFFFQFFFFAFGTMRLHLKPFSRKEQNSSEFWGPCAWKLQKRIIDMIGETGMVENFDVSLSSSFIRKKRQQERECGFYLQSTRCNVLRLKCEWM